MFATLSRRWGRGGGSGFLLLLAGSLFLTRCGVLGVETDGVEDGFVSREGEDTLGEVET